ncbi:MAG: hypothetical protein D6791_18535 [Chloroflexi bacterium]|nr:MAG: hypothetical protein D6791_18535 [Chloroflexota bacterium]
MENQPGDNPEPEVQDEVYPEPGVWPAADPEGAAHDEGFLESEVDDAESVTTIEIGTARAHPLLTLVVGLVIGLVVGYLGRPLITPEPQSTTAASQAGAADPASATGKEVANSSASSAGSQTLMDAVVAQTRHFRGDPNAPVTIIEFSDFQ